MMAVALRSVMITSPPMSNPRRSTLTDAERGHRGLRPPRAGRGGTERVGEGGVWVLGERPPPGARAIGEIICEAQDRRSTPSPASADPQASNAQSARPQMGPSRGGGPPFGLEK